MGQSAASAKSGNLGVTLATWVFILHETGHPPAAGAVADAVTALSESGADGADHAGRKLIEVVESELGEDADTERVLAWLRSLYGDNALTESFGDARDARLRGARAHQFRSSLPWIARIIDRFPNGEVGPHWVMVERVTDRVTIMDPYPWDDLDEEYEQPVIEFLVKWELAGCDTIAWS